jgi:uncharacterized protein YbcI
MSGRPPTIETVPLKQSAGVRPGDLVNLEDGTGDLGATGDLMLLGAAISNGRLGSRVESIRVIVDSDAVYAVDDPNVRLKGATLDLAGASGAQGLGPLVNGEFVVDVDSSAEEETLVRIVPAKHYRRLAATDHVEPMVGGKLNEAVARMVVRYHAELFGRGPTKASAFYRDDMMVVVLRDAMTKAERSLLAAGQADAVQRMRRAFQDAMRLYLRSAIERLTGSKVRAFMSASNLEPDLAVEIFMVDPPVGLGPAEAGSRAPAGGAESPR